MSEEERKFIKETVKEKPINKKKIAIRIIVSALSGLAFAVVACGVMAFLLPKWVNVAQSIEDAKEAQSSHTTDVVEVEVDKKNEPELDNQPDAKVEENKDSKEDSDSKVDKDDKNSKTENDTEIDSQGIYQEAIDDLYQIGVEADQKIVKVNSVSSGLDLFNNPYENSKAACGIIIRVTDKKLLVLTDYSVIDADSEIDIELNDETRVPASIVSFDERSGMCIVGAEAKDLDKEYFDQIEAIGLAPLAMRLGQTVMAVGSPQGNIHGVVRGNVTSRGDLISVIDANYSYLLTDIIQMKDTAGYLVNSKGQLAGVLVKNYTDTLGKNCIVAIPITELRGTIDKLCDGKQIPYVGVNVNVVTADVSDNYYIPRGIYVRETIMDSPAMEAGIMPGDIITHVAGEEVTTDSGFKSKLLGLEVDKEVEFTIRRQSSEGYIELQCQVTPSVYR